MPGAIRKKKFQPPSGGFEDARTRGRKYFGRATPSKPPEVLTPSKLPELKKDLS